MLDKAVKEKIRNIFIYASIIAMGGTFIVFMGWELEKGYRNADCLERLGKINCITLSMEYLDADYSKYECVDSMSELHTKYFTKYEKKWCKNT